MFKGLSTNFEEQPLKDILLHAKHCPAIKLLLGIRYYFTNHLLCCSKDVFNLYLCRNKLRPIFTYFAYIIFINP